VDTSALRRLLTYLVAGALALGAGVRLLEPPRPPAAPVRIEADGEAAGPDATRPDAGAKRIYVDVAGAVRRPGLYRVPAGARVGEAVERAGGRTRSAAPAGINLAARVEDGQQVVVAAETEGPGPPQAASSPATVVPGPV
jgi:competence protein ComEA